MIFKTCLVSTVGVSPFFTLLSNVAQYSQPLFSHQETDTDPDGRTKGVQVAVLTILEDNGTSSSRVQGISIVLREHCSQRYSRPAHCICLPVQPALRPEHQVPKRTKVHFRSDRESLHGTFY